MLKIGDRVILLPWEQKDCVKVWLNPEMRLFFGGLATIDANYLKQHDAYFISADRHSLSKGGRVTWLWPAERLVLQPTKVNVEGVGEITLIPRK